MLIKKTILLKRLHFLMTEYCKKYNKNIQHIKKRMYLQYNIESRSQLKYRDLAKIIDEFEISLLHNIE